MRKHLPNPARQLKPDQTRKHHNVLGRVHTPLNRIPARARLKLLLAQLVDLIAARHDRPDHDVADRARDDDGEVVKGVCGLADCCDAAVGVEGQDAGGCYVLCERELSVCCVCVYVCDVCTYVNSKRPSTLLKRSPGIGELEQDSAAVDVL